MDTRYITDDYINYNFILLCLNVIYFISFHAIIYIVQVWINLCRGNLLICILTIFCISTESFHFNPCILKVLTSDTNLLLMISSLAYVFFLEGVLTWPPTKTTQHGKKKNSWDSSSMRWWLYQLRHCVIEWQEDHVVHKHSLNSFWRWINNKMDLNVTYGKIKEKPETQRVVDSELK